MSWMISAVRVGIERDLVALTGASPHVRELVAADLALDAVERGRGRDEQDVPVRAAPVEVADVLGHLDGADLLAVGVEDAHAARAGDPDVAALVELHPVDEVADVQVARADALGDDARVRHRAVVGDVEDADVRVSVSLT